MLTSDQVYDCTGCRKQKQRRRRNYNELHLHSAVFMLTIGSVYRKIGLFDS